MTINVGIDPNAGYLSYYKEAEKRTSSFQIMKVAYEEITLVKLMYEEINLKINTNLGYACICLRSEYTNEIRKKFIEEGLKIGFKNIEIINGNAADYVNGISQIREKPLNGDIIWIIWGKEIYVWQIYYGKAKFIGEWKADSSNLNLLKQVMKESKLNKGPNIVLHNAEIDKANFKKISNCRFFIFNSENYRTKGSLLKARIAAGDPELIGFDAENCLFSKMVIKYGNEEITPFKYGEPLPASYSQTFQNHQHFNDIKIISQFKKVESFNLPQKNEICLMLEVDTNEIYSVKLSEDEQEMDNLLESKLSTFLEATSYTIPNIPMNTVKNTVGIDLGTSRCCAAVNRKNGITTVPLDNTGERILPSYVGYDEEKVKCGKIVINRLRFHSKSTIFDSKRIIGRKMDDIEIDSIWPFGIQQHGEKVLIEIQKYSNSAQICAEDVASELLKYIKQKSEEFQGIKLDSAVITVPAAFTVSQKEATIQAAKLAAFDSVKLLPEPIAAAFAYFHDRPFPENSTVLVFDLGGGTLDVCIFKIENHQIKIISDTGDGKLGGRDFDTVLFNYFKNHLKMKYNISLTKDKKFKLIFECQKIKEDLSVIENCDLSIDEFDTNQEDIISITQKEFKNLTKPLVNRIQNTLSAALQRSKKNPEEINKILMAGGGSRMPMAKKLLKRMFPKAEQCIHENPDEVVAIGAAYYACSVFSQ